jgi:two-component system heavy metal sensor histidine kinase CusS
VIAVRSLTLRLTLLFALASTAVLLSLGVLIADAVDRHFEEEDLDQLGGKVEMVRRLLARTADADSLAALPQKMDEGLVGAQGLAIAVIGPSRETLFAARNADFPQPLLDAGSAADVRHPLVWRQGERSYRGIVARLPTAMPGWPQATVAVATEISHHLHFLAAFDRNLWGFVAVAALLTGLLGWGAARRGLAPLRDIGRGAAAVTASRLDYRLDLAALPAEIAELAAALNDMLARLEDSFRRLSEFSSDLAHELRTPVGNLMTETQVALSRARSADEYREVLVANSEEFERLGRTIGDMLFLARAEHGLAVPRRESVDLAENVRELFDFYEALAEEKGVRLELSGVGCVTGDRLMLRRAIGNLLSNAIRHAPRGGLVGVRLEQGGDGAIHLAVENTGETIAAEHLPRLFDRFYRADPSRQRSGEGAGLGLAIVRSIVRAHGGEIGVTSADGVTTFRLQLPAEPVRMS